MSVLIDEIGSYRQEITPEQFKELYNHDAILQQRPTAEINRIYKIVKGEAVYRVSRERGVVKIRRCARDEFDKMDLLRMIESLKQDVAEIKCQLRRLREGISEEVVDTNTFGNSSSTSSNVEFST